MAHRGYSDLLTIVFGVFATIAAVAAIVVGLLQLCSTRALPTRRRRIAELEGAVRLTRRTDLQSSMFSRPSRTLSVPPRAYLAHQSSVSSSALRTANIVLQIHGSEHILHASDAVTNARHSLNAIRTSHAQRVRLRGWTRTLLLMCQGLLGRRQ